MSWNKTCHRTKSFFCFVTLPYRCNSYASEVSQEYIFISMILFLSRKLICKEVSQNKTLFVQWQFLFLDTFSSLFESGVGGDKKSSKDKLRKIEPTKRVAKTDTGRSNPPIEWTTWSWASPDSWPTHWNRVYLRACWHWKKIECYIFSMHILEHLWLHSKSGD